MKRLIILSTIGLLATHSFSQKKCTIKNEYDKIFKIEKAKYNGKEHLTKMVNKIDSNSCFSDFVNNNTMYLDYLQTNFSDKTNYKKLLSITDTVELQKEYINSLKTDSTFNNVMHKLTQKITQNSNYIPDTVSIDDLLNIAVKYFYVSRIKPPGNYTGRVCIGINGIKQTEKERKPHVEAFCFTSILNNYEGEKYNISNEFAKGIKELYKINLGTENDERLLRAQGAMYMFMRNNEELKKMLLFEYNNKKDTLPFVLK